MIVLLLLGSNVFSVITGKEREAVRVSGARGLPPTDSYKVSATYLDGYRLTAVCVVIGGRAVAKARKTADAIIRRCVNLLPLPELLVVKSKVKSSQNKFFSNQHNTKYAMCYIS